MLNHGRRTARLTVLRHSLLQAWAVDTDGDGVDDSIDAFPNNAEATTDTDGDGKPDSIDSSKAPIVFSDAFDGTAFQSGWSATSLWLVSSGSAAYKLNLSQGNSASFSRVFNVPSGGELSFRHVRSDNCASGDLWVDSIFNRSLFQAGRGTWELTTVNLAVGSHLVEWRGRCNSLANTVALRVDDVVLRASSLVVDADDDSDGLPDAFDPAPLDSNSVWPLNGNYKGSAVRESQIVQ